jgi:Leucine Rich repeat
MNVSERCCDLSSLSNLRQLNLTDCYNITDIGIQYLSSLCNLQQLILSRCYNITDNGIQYLSSLSNLRQLELWGCSNITDNGIQLILALLNSGIVKVIVDTAWILSYLILYSINYNLFKIQIFF